MRKLRNDFSRLMSGLTQILSTSESVAKRTMRRVKKQVVGFSDFTDIDVLLTPNSRIFKPTFSRQMDWWTAPMMHLRKNKNEKSLYFFLFFAH